VKVISVGLGIQTIWEKWWSTVG